jgi:hypothetical protein
MWEKLTDLTSQRASIQQIKDFLSLVSKEIRNKRFQLIPRDKNLKDITRLGLKPEFEIQDLTYKDYDREPLPDDNGNGYIWEFIKEVDGLQIYIKLKHDQRGCICLSIHQAQGPSSLPYQEK